MPVNPKLNLLKCQNCRKKEHFFPCMPVKKEFFFYSITTSTKSTEIKVNYSDRSTSGLDYLENAWNKYYIPFYENFIFWNFFTKYVFCPLRYF